MWNEILALTHEMGALKTAAGEGQWPVAAFNVPEGAKAPFAAQVCGGRALLVIAPNEQQAERMRDDLALALGKPVALFPARELTLYPVEATSRERESARVAVLMKLLSGELDAVVATWEAVASWQVTPELFAQGIREFKEAQQLTPEDALKALLESGYTVEDMVEGQGQAARRGGILDVFPPDSDLPVRIEFFGDEIDTLRSFDPLTQRSVERLQSVRIPPASEAFLDADALRKGLSKLKSALRSAKHSSADAPQENDEAPKPNQPAEPTRADIALSSESSHIISGAADGGFAIDSSALAGFWPDEDLEIEALPSSAATPAAAPVVWEDDEPEAEESDIARALAITADNRKPHNARERLEESVHRIELAVEGGAHPHALDVFLPYFLAEPSTLLDYMPSALIVLDEPARLKERADNTFLEFAELFKSQLEAGGALRLQSRLHLGYEPVMTRIAARHCLTMQLITQRSPHLRPKAAITFNMRAMHAFYGRIDQLAQDVIEWKRGKYRVVLFAGGVSRAKRLESALLDLKVNAPYLEKPRAPEPGEAIILAQPVSRGFEAPESKLAIVGDSDIFGAKQRIGAKKRRSSKQGRPIDAFTDLSPGDFVVHEDHGVGVYKGIKRLVVESRARDYLHLAFAGTDALYIPTDQMDKVQKYIGMRDNLPRLNKLGGGDWQKAKQKVRESIREMTEGLVKLYAQRSAAKGHAFSEDSQWQRQFEENFPYEETPDQLNAVAEIKKDMERPLAMDRLLCGDVGYGKTEVALRAAFKAVQDSKQVAVLVPTTLLAQQHYQTIMERFSGFPITCELLCRFRTSSEQKESIKRLKEGRLDIIVGTHRLISKDVKFHNLGLLIVDEEQRFGVGHKEKIKQLKTNVDVLTLTATPIPRTLHMSMVGIRDMSLIENPPEERYPVQTFVSEYNDMQIQGAIRRELSRAGQVYFLYNRVMSIDRFKGYLERLVPEARIAVAHGQMKEQELEDVMMDFLERKSDVLLCTTIIESGIDIPNVNTMIVYDADRFGLAQLYQLRGRVGRSNRVAYAYFCYKREKVLSEIAEKRLRAILEFTEFGSGFKIAMRDLEIRGAGNLLGPEQHGHISGVGYAMYVKLMEEETAKLRGEILGEKRDTAIEVQLDAYLPDDYVPSGAQKIDVYKRIAAIASYDDYDDVYEEVVDRFGDAPQPVMTLFSVAKFKVLCRAAGIEHVGWRAGGELLMRFAENAEFDPQPLFAALADSRGLITLKAAQPPSLRAFKKGAPSERLIDLAIEFLEKAIPL